MNPGIVDPIGLPAFLLTDFHSSHFVRRVRFEDRGLHESRIIARRGIRRHDLHIDGRGSDLDEADIERAVVGQLGCRCSEGLLGNVGRDRPTVEAESERIIVGTGKKRGHRERLGPQMNEVGPCGARQCHVGPDLGDGRLHQFAVAAMEIVFKGFSLDIGNVIGNIVALGRHLQQHAVLGHIPRFNRKGTVGHSHRLENFLDQPRRKLAVRIHTVRIGAILGSGFESVFRKYLLAGI